MLEQFDLSAQSTPADPLDDSLAQFVRSVFRYQWEQRHTFDPADWKDLSFARHLHSYLGTYFWQDLFHERAEVRKILNDLDTEPIQIVHGVRGVGKSTVIQRCLIDLQNDSPSTTVVVDCHDRVALQRMGQAGQPACIYTLRDSTSINRVVIAVDLGAIGGDDALRIKPSTRAADPFDYAYDALRSFFAPRHEDVPAGFGEQAADDRYAIMDQLLGTAAFSELRTAISRVHPTADGPTMRLLARSPEFVDQRIASWRKFDEIPGPEKVRLLLNWTRTRYPNILVVLVIDNIDWLEDIDAQATIFETMQHLVLNQVPMHFLAGARTETVSAFELREGRPARVEATMLAGGCARGVRTTANSKNGLGILDARTAFIDNYLLRHGGVPGSMVDKDGAGEYTADGVALATSLRAHIATQTDGAGLGGFMTNSMERLLRSQSSPFKNHFLRWHNMSYRSSLAALTDFTSSIMRGQDPAYIDATAYHTWPGDRRQERFKSKVLRHLTWGEAAPGDTPQNCHLLTPGSFGEEGTDKAIHLPPLWLLLYVAGNPGSAWLSWGDIRSFCTDFGMSRSAAHRLVAHLSDVDRGFESQGLFDMRRDLSAKFTANSSGNQAEFRALSSTQFYLNRLAISAEYLCWTHMYGGTDKRITAFLKPSSKDRPTDDKMIPYKALDSQLNRAVIAYRFLAWTVGPWFIADANLALGRSVRGAPLLKSVGIDGRERSWLHKAVGSVEQILQNHIGDVARYEHTAAAHQDVEDLFNELKDVGATVERNTKG